MAIKVYQDDAANLKFVDTIQTTARTLDYIVKGTGSIAESQTLTNKTLTSPLFTGTIDGWITAGTFTYASATTITVASGAASIYQKGDKIKLTQTTVKYFYITAVADTLLTVTGGTDYTVANAAITLPYYSHIENPLGFPTAFTSALTYGAETGTWTSVTAAMSRFRLIGKTCFIGGAYEGTTSDSTTYLTITLPVAPLNANNELINVIVRNGAGWFVSTGGGEFYSSILRVSYTFTAGANRGFKLQGFYEI